MPIPPVPPHIAAALGAKASKDATHGATRLGVSAGRSGIRMVIGTGAKIIFRFARFLVKWIIIPYMIFTGIDVALMLLSEKVFPHWDNLYDLRVDIDSLWWNFTNLITSWIPDWITLDI